jgi:hypothetical protein
LLGDLLLDEQVVCNSTTRTSGTIVEDLKCVHFVLTTAELGCLETQQTGGKKKNGIVCNMHIQQAFLQERMRENPQNSPADGEPRNKL